VKAEDLRTLDPDELDSRFRGARRELYELRFKLAVGQLDDHRQIRKVRKDIARILTVVHARRLGEDVQETPVADEAGELEVVATRVAARPSPVAVEASQEASEVQASKDEAEAPGGEPNEETPENVETALAAESPAPASRKTSRRGRAAGEVGND
jgi:large subunit ribosomal protein L29